VETDRKPLERIGENVESELKSLVPETPNGMQQRVPIALKKIALLVLLSFSLTAQAQTGTPTATVNWSDVQQTMDGWGAQDWTYSDNLSSSLCDQFFSPTAGIGLAYIRTQTTFDNGIPDTPTLQCAVARGAKVWLEVQPPCSLRHSFVELGEDCTNSQSGGDDHGTQPPGYTDGTTSSNGTCFTSSQPLATSYSQYATFIVARLTQFAAAGAPVSVLGVINEPDDYYCFWGDSEHFGGPLIRDFIKVLGPVLSAAGLHPQLLMPQVSNWFGIDDTTDCLNDATCSSLVSIVAGHGYGYPFTPTSYPLAASTGHHLWLSETGSQAGTFDGSISDALTWATNIHGWLTVANVSTADWWSMAYTGNFGLMNSTFTNRAKRFYAEGQWSKFVRPGWVRIGATAAPVSGVFITAFKDPVSGNFAIVAVNQTASAQPLNFALSGFTAASVTPWVTSASLNLARQPSISTAVNTFSDTLPASSVTTFVSTSSKALPPPTNLHATIH
jgi:glucuronoarabinoxylan endo-1,4-beta-xylanase